jgi:hypothetical protein
VPYTIWSRDRLLGETDLGYVRCMPKHRMGDLTPSAIGERLLASEAHLDSLQLELRGSDGRVIPTEWIDVRDTEQLLALAGEIPDEDFDDAEMDPQLRADIDHDRAVIEEWDREREPDGLWEDYDRSLIREWQDTVMFPRYQVQVRLIDDADVP